MPYDSVTAARKDFPQLKGMSTKQVRTFIGVFNGLIEDGYSEDEAIPQALSAAQDMEKSNTMTPIHKAFNEELRESVEVVYEPYKVDGHGHWMRPETIRKACENFNENLANGNLKRNFYHSKDENGKIIPTEAFTVEKTWVNEVECQIGDQIVPEGTWIAKVKWNSDAHWNQRKAGVLQGLSIGGMGRIKSPETTEE